MEVVTTGPSYRESIAGLQPSINTKGVREQRVYEFWGFACQVLHVASHG